MPFEQGTNREGNDAAHLVDAAEMRFSRPATRRVLVSEAGDELRRKGEATRRAVLGDAHVDRANAARDDFSAPFQDLITDAAWGHVWSDDTLTRRERSLVTLALLAGRAQWDEFELHLRATVNTGASRDDVREVIRHVAVYAGVPNANHAMKLARAVLDERAA